MNLRLAPLAGALFALASCGGLPAEFEEYRCGDQTVSVGVAGDALHLQIGKERRELRRAEAASGAKYEAPNDPDTMFWSKGNRATLMVDGRMYPECVQGNAEPTAESHPLTGGEWFVESLNGEPVRSDSVITLRFGEDGRVSGSAGCNTYGAQFQVVDDALTTDKTMSTMMACAENLMAQERTFLDLLAAVERYAIDGSGALILRAGDGVVIVARRQN